MKAKAKKKDGFLHELSKNKTLFLMILPVLVYFFVFSYLPMVGVYYAFTNFNFKDGLFGSPFVGLKNFEFLFRGGKDAIIWSLTKNTVLYNLAFILIGNVLQILVAIILSELTSKIFKKVSQSIMFLPYFISYVIIGVFIYNIFNYEVGLANGMLKSLGKTPVDFYGKPEVWQ